MAVALSDALDEMARVLERGSMGRIFTCRQADALAEVLVMAGHPKPAARFLLGHSRRDKPEGALHHGFDHESSQRYVLLRWGSVILLD